MKTKFFKATDLSTLFKLWQKGQAQALHIRHVTRDLVLACNPSLDPPTNCDLFGLFLEKTSNNPAGDVLIAVYTAFEIGKLRLRAEKWGERYYLAVYDHHQSYINPCEASLLNHLEAIKLTEDLDITEVKFNIRKAGKRPIGSTCLAKVSVANLLLLASFGYIVEPA